METAPQGTRVIAPGDIPTDERLKHARACLAVSMPEAAAFHLCMIDVTDLLTPEVTALREEIRRAWEG